MVTEAQAVVILSRSSLPEAQAAVILSRSFLPVAQTMAILSYSFLPTNPETVHDLQHMNLIHRLTVSFSERNCVS